MFKAIPPFLRASKWQKLATLTASGDTTILATADANFPITSSLHARRLLKIFATTDTDVTLLFKSGSTTISPPIYLKSAGGHGFALPYDGETWFNDFAVNEAIVGNLSGTANVGLWIKGYDEKP